MMRIVYSGSSGSITNATGTWAITAKPDLGFVYDGIFADSETETALKFMGEGRIHLTPAEIAATRAYVSAQVKPAPPAPTAADLALSAQVNADIAALAAGKAEPIIQYLVTHTPAECNAYIQANVTNLAQAKAMLGKFAMALCVLSKASFR